MTVNWWWVRHGPTHAKAFNGHTDIAADLSDLPALHRLHDFLPADAVVISSDLVRASKTADAIAGTRLRLRHSKQLREMDFGAWEGMEFDAVAKSHPELSRQFWESPGDVSPPKGESWNRFSSRVHREIDAISMENKHQNIIAVAHFGVILAAVQLAGNLPSSSVFSFKINNLSVTRLTQHQPRNGWSIQTVNQIV